MKNIVKLKHIYQYDELVNLNKKIRQEFVMLQKKQQVVTKMNASLKFSRTHYFVKNIRCSTFLVNYPKNKFSFTLRRSQLFASPTRTIPNSISVPIQSKPKRYIMAYTAHNSSIFTSH